jgi:hypothetical protein
MSYVDPTILVEVKFEGSQLHDMLIGNIFDVNGRKIRITGSGTKTGEFRKANLYRVIPLRVRIRP